MGQFQQFRAPSSPEQHIFVLRKERRECEGQKGRKDMQTLGKLGLQMFLNMKVS